MASWVALSREVHQGSGWKKRSDYAFAQQDAVAPLLMAELAHALPYYPIAFVQSADPSNSEFQLMALQSLQVGVNVFVHKSGQWLAPYVPSIYRGYPFRLVAQGEQLIFCVDGDVTCFHAQMQPGDAPIFKADSTELSDELSAMLAFHRLRYQNVLLTQQVVNALAAANVLVPWHIELKANETAKASVVQGLFKVDETALKALDAQALVALQACGALGLAYAQLFSQVRLNDFGKRYEYFNKMHQKPLDLDLDKLFGDDDDSIKF